MIFFSFFVVFLSEVVEEVSSEAEQRVVRSSEATEEVIFKV